MLGRGARVVLGDLGQIVAPEVIALYDYLNDPSTPAALMEVTRFRWAQDVDSVGPVGSKLYFSELQIADYVSG